MQNVNERKTSISCCGCGCCSAVCPVSSISMQLSSEGFWEPQISSDCIHCGKCVQVCYKYMDSQQDEFYHLKDQMVYAAAHKNTSVVRGTSSGGVAYGIAELFLNKGYVICGAWYNPNTQFTEHIFVYKKSELWKISGSKYLQSNTESAWKTILSSDIDKYVVFGLPCQIAGLRKMLGEAKRKKQIILIDLFCHGVPTYHLWNSYLQYMCRKYKQSEHPLVSFRDKRNGWHYFTIKLTWQNYVYYGRRDRDWFYRVFFSNTVLNQSCYSCKTRQVYSGADIRLGDFWGNTFNRTDSGISCVIPLSECGAKIIKQLEDVEFKAVFPYSSLKGTQGIFDDYPPKMNWNTYIDLLRKGEIKKVCKMNTTLKQQLLSLFSVKFLLLLKQICRR